MPSEELKTLKDLEKDFEWKYDTFKGLKQEAIKWVKVKLKELDERKKILLLKGIGKGNEIPQQDHNYSYLEGYIKGLYDFFNLSTEES